MAPVKHVISNPPHSVDNPCNKSSNLLIPILTFDEIQYLLTYSNNAMYEMTEKV